MLVLRDGGLPLLDLEAVIASLDRGREAKFIGWQCPWLECLWDWAVCSYINGCNVVLPLFFFLSFFLCFLARLLNCIWVGRTVRVFPSFRLCWSAVHHHIRQSNWQGIKICQFWSAPPWEFTLSHVILSACIFVFVLQLLNKRSSCHRGGCHSVTSSTYSPICWTYRQYSNCNPNFLTSNLSDHLDGGYERKARKVGVNGQKVFSYCEIRSWKDKGKTTYN